MLSIALFILNELTGHGMWAADPPSYPTLIPVSDPNTDAVQMKPGTFWEALGTYAVAAVVLGGIGWWAFERAERKTIAQGYYDVEDPAIRDALGLDPDWDPDTAYAMLRDEQAREIAERDADPEVRANRLENARLALGGTTLQGKMALRDEWARQPDKYSDLIALADEMIREEMGA